jgi:hypothetical protein
MSGERAEPALPLRREAVAESQRVHGGAAVFVGRQPAAARDRGVREDAAL